MQKVIFLGTDLHGAPTELAATLVTRLQRNTPGSHILSLQYRKPFVQKTNITIIPKIFNNIYFKRIAQAITLPLDLIKLRRLGYNTISSFWTTGTLYHKLLFCAIKKMGYRIIYTAITQHEHLNLSVLRSCDEIVAQSPKAYDYLKIKLPGKKINLIWPGIDLEAFKPGVKRYDLIIPSVPYDVKDFDGRGINKIIKIIRENNLSAVIIFRSREAYEEVGKMKIKNVRLVYKSLTDAELSWLVGQCKVMPLFYEDSPEVPLSAVEGLACGCTLVLSDNIGICEIVKKNNCGAIARNELELEELVKKFVKKDVVNNCRKVAEKYFDFVNMVKAYKNIER